MDKGHQPHGGRRSARRPRCVFFVPVALFPRSPGVPEQANHSLPSPSSSSSTPFPSSPTSAHCPTSARVSRRSSSSRTPMCGRYTWRRVSRTAPRTSLLMLCQQWRDRRSDGALDDCWMSCSLWQRWRPLSLLPFLANQVLLPQSETSLLDTVIFLPTTRKSVYSVILPLSIGVLAATGQQLNTLVKNSLSSLVLVAFASFAELQERAPEFEKWVRGKAGRKENELGELVHAFRGTCLSSLPGFLDEVKVRSPRSVVRLLLTSGPPAGLGHRCANISGVYRRRSEPHGVECASLCPLHAMWKQLTLPFPGRRLHAATLRQPVHRRVVPRRPWARQLGRPFQSRSTQSECRGLHPHHSLSQCVSPPFAYLVSSADLNRSQTTFSPHSSPLSTIAPALSAPSLVSPPSFFSTTSPSSGAKSSRPK